MDMLTPCLTGATPHKPFDLDSQNPLKERSVLTSPWTWTCRIHVKERSVLTNSPTWTRKIHVREGQPPQTENPCEDRTSDPFQLSLDSCNTQISCTDCAHSRTSSQGLNIAWLPDSLSTRTTSKSPVPTVPVPVSLCPSIFYNISSVSLPPQTSVTLLTNTQATSHEKPMDTPIVPERP